MRGQAILSYALVAFASTAYAAPLKARIGGGVTVARYPFIVPEGVPGNLRRREEDLEIDAATATSSSKKPAGTAPAPKATPTPKGTAPAPKATGKATTPSKAGSTGTAPKAPAKAPAAKATTPADLPGCPAGAKAPEGAAKSTGAAKPTGAKATPKPTSTGTAGKKPAARGAKPLGCDPTKPEVAAAPARKRQTPTTDPITGLLSGAGTGAGAASPSGSAAADPLAALLGGLSGTGSGTSTGGGDLLSGLTGGGSTTPATGGVSALIPDKA